MPCPITGFVITAQHVCIIILVLIPIILIHCVVQSCCCRRCCSRPCSWGRCFILFFVILIHPMEAPIFCCLLSRRWQGRRGWLRCSRLRSRCCRMCSRPRRCSRHWCSSRSSTRTSSGCRARSRCRSCLLARRWDTWFGCLLLLLLCCLTRHCRSMGWCACKVGCGRSRRP